MSPLRLGSSVSFTLPGNVAPPGGGGGSEGGFLELSTDEVIRDMYDTTDIAAFMPATRSTFTFPSPYLTKAWRVTIPADSPANNIDHAGYPYWPKVQKVDNLLYVIVGLNHATNGNAHYVTINLDTDVVSAPTPIFSNNTTDAQFRGTEQMYFSGTVAKRMYYNGGSSGYSDQLRYRDIVSGTDALVVDINSHTGTYGLQNRVQSSGGYYRRIFQPTSSLDDNVHAFSVVEYVWNTGTSQWDITEIEGMGVWTVGTSTPKFYGATFINTANSNFNEGQVDKGGLYIHMDDGTVSPGALLDSRVFRLSDDREAILLSANGGSGHGDMGYGVRVQHDDSRSPNGHIAPIDVTQATLTSGTSIAYPTAGYSIAGNHLSFNHAQNAALSGQWVLGSQMTTPATNGPRSNEIIMIKGDGSLKQVVVAPVMTTDTGAGYASNPFANTDRTGRYAAYTTNLAVQGGLRTWLVVRLPDPTTVTGWT